MQQTGGETARSVEPPLPTLSAGRAAAEAEAAAAAAAATAAAAAAAATATAGTAAQGVAAPSAPAGAGMPAADAAGTAAPDTAAPEEQRGASWPIPQPKWEPTRARSARRLGGRSITRGDGPTSASGARCGSGVGPAAGQRGRRGAGDGRGSPPSPSGLPSRREARGRCKTWTSAAIPAAIPTPPCSKGSGAAAPDATAPNAIDRRKGDRRCRRR